MIVCLFEGGLKHVQALFSQSHPVGALAKDEAGRYLFTHSNKLVSDLPIGMQKQELGIERKTEPSREWVG